MFPAASRAVTVRRLAPAWRTMPPAVQLVVPVAVPVPPRSFAHVTWVAAAAAAAVPRSARAVLQAEEAGDVVGAAVATVGAAVAAVATVTVMPVAVVGAAAERRL